MMIRGLRMSKTLALAALLASCAAAASAQEPAAPEGQRVALVRIVTADGRVLAENPPDLPLQAGQSFRAEAVRESLRQLYRSGRYADVQAESSPRADGVQLDFVIRENEYINAVRVTGVASSQHENLALASVRLGLGEVFRQRDLEDALERLRQTLAEIGYYEARVAPELARNTLTRQTDIVFRIERGPRARFGEITVQRLDEGAANDLLRRSKLRPGQSVAQDRLERGAERLRKYLFDRGFLGARVTPRRGAYDAATQRVPLQLEVFAGPRVRVRVEGAKISQRQMRKLLPIYEEGAVDEDLLQEGRRDLRDYFETQGYFDARVSFTTQNSPADSAQEIVYQVDLGRRWRLAGVTFEGNEAFDAQLLRSRLRILPAARLSPGRFSSRLLADDVDSIRDLYVANGFRDAEVRAERREDFRGRQGELLVHFRIREGQQVLVSNLELEGNHALSTEYLLANAIDYGPGQAFSEMNMASDRNNVLTYYFNEGFPEARMEVFAEPAAEPYRINVKYRISEGSQVRVKKIFYSGEEFTRLSTIQREVQLVEGGPLRQGAVVESQRRLYNLGIFNRVQIAPQNPSGGDTEKAVVVLVEEAKRYTLAYGGGVEVQRLGSGSDPAAGDVRVSPRGILELTRLNVGGRAHTLSFKGRASTLQGRALLSYTAPSLFALPRLSFQLTGFADKTSDVRTFTSTRYEGSVQFAHELLAPPAFWRGSSFLYRYVYRRVQVDAASLRVDPNAVPLFSQPTRISAFGATWVRERRRENPADPTFGDFNNLDVSVAPKGIGSQASFVRLFFQNSTFHPFGRNLVFARSTRFGVQMTFGGTRDAEVPLPERFFAGGGNSLRGFGLNQAGPRDAVTGFPLGGLAMLLFNNELRFPMRLPFTALRLGGAVFYDAGNVFDSVSRISLRSRPPSPSDINYFSHTLGFSVRYSTPIGPVRVDLGYALNPARFEFCAASAPPNPLRCPAGQGITSARLPRFQIFFNIGSMF
jgi:outer membrane protein assembly complex protein YaeT